MNIHKTPIFVFDLFTQGGARHPDPRASVRAVGVEAAEAAPRRGDQVDAARGVREGDAGDPGVQFNRHLEFKA